MEGDRVGGGTVIHGGFPALLCMLLPPSENKDFYYIKVWTNLRRSTFDYELSNYDDFLMEKKTF